MTVSWLKLAGPLLLALNGTMPSVGEPIALDDEELATVSGRGGFSVALQLKFSSRMALGFEDGLQTTYFALDGVGGEADIWSLSFDLEPLPDTGGSYLRVGMPRVVGFRDFGFDAAGVVADPALAVPPPSNMGQLHLNGNGAMTGNLLMWAD